MAPSQSRLTSQGQVSVPAAIRKKLGLGPGSVIEWAEDGEQIIVRKAGRHDLAETRRALGFEQPPRRRSLAELKEGLRASIQGRRARH